jgi:hypothetical protein
MNKPTRVILSQLSHLMDVLERNGATVVPVYDGDKILYVNGAKVLVRHQNTRSNNTCIELFHESNRNVWVRSWGLTSDATWLLVVADKQHRWYNLPALRVQLSDGITTNDIDLVNNSYITRQHNGPSANVMNVWIPKGQSTYLSDTHTYQSFLAGVR